MQILTSLLVLSMITSKKVNNIEKGGGNMTDSQKILELAQQKNGIITTAMVAKAGIARGTLKYLSDNGNIEKSSRGVYTLPGMWDDEFVNIQNRFKRGIYALETALFLCDLTDRTPRVFNMVFPATYNLSGPRREGIVCSGSKESFYNLGVIELITPAGNTVKGYCAERSLCDVLRARNHTDIQIVTDAFKKYTSRKEKNIPLLAR